MKSLMKLEMIGDVGTLEGRFEKAEVENYCDYVGQHLIIYQTITEWGLGW